MNTIHIVFGPQGAGKTTYSKKLAAKINGIHFSIDDWMWKLYGDDLPKTMNLKWIMERVERCEKQIWSLTKNISQSGSEVILDLGFTKLAKRKKFLELSKENKIPTQLHILNAPHDLRRQRVLDRNINKGETFSFEVTPGMFDFMEKEFDRPIDSELDNAIVIDTGL